MPDAIPPESSETPEQGLATRLSHAGRPGKHVLGFVNPPVHRGSTVLYPTMSDRRASWTKRLDQAWVYGTLGSPTHHALENVVAEIEGGTRCQITSSGLSAVTTPLLAFLSAGDHCLVPDSVYGPTRLFCDSLLTRMGVATTYYDPCIDADALQALLRPQTKVLYLESPGSHSFEVQDVPALSAVAHAHGAKVLMDNTWGVHFFQPFRHGVDVSIQALTKYVAGHSDVLLGGITTANDADWERVRMAAIELGQYASPDDVWLALRGARTLAVRLQRQQESGLAVARWLEQRDRGGAGAAPRPALLPRPSFLGARFFRRLQPVRFCAAAAIFGRCGRSDVGLAETVRHRSILGRLRELDSAQCGNRAQLRHRRFRRRNGAPACGAGRPGGFDGRPGARVRGADGKGLVNDAVLAAVVWNADGLVPAIAQQYNSGEVLMLAWMDRDALAETLATRRVCYFSRSRAKLWRKGETSGQVQHLVELRIDCDGDALLLLVAQTGVACHTGRRSCFFRAARSGAMVEIAAPLVAPDQLYG